MTRSREIGRLRRLSRLEMRAYRMCVGTPYGELREKRRDKWFKFLNLWHAEVIAATDRMFGPGAWSGAGGSLPRERANVGPSPADSART